MNIEEIKNDDDLVAVFSPLESIYQAEAGSAEPDEMEALVALIECYENKHYPIKNPGLIEAHGFQMEQFDSEQKDI